MHNYRLWWIEPKKLASYIVHSNPAGLINCDTLRRLWRLARQVGIDLAELRDSRLASSGNPMAAKRELYFRSYRANMPMAAANIANIVAPTTTRESIELGWFSINLRSQATNKIPTSRKGARRPFMIALQYRAFTGLISRKFMPMPTSVENIKTV